MPNKQESLMKLQALEQEATVFGEQIQLVENQIKELNLLKNSLSHLNNSKEASSYAEFGKGIYIKTKLEKSDLLVDVGNKIFVPKKAEEVEKIIGEQVEKFNRAKIEIENRIQSINKELDLIINEANRPAKAEAQKEKAAKVKKAKKGN